MTGDVSLHAVLAVEQAMSEADRQRILERFRNSSLNGANVSDILDILDDHDALLELREPFYEDGPYEETLRLLGWQLGEEFTDNYGTRLKSRLVGFSCLALAILTTRIPEPQAVADLARAGHEVADARWPGGEYLP